ncbi:18830_t:CDS:2, partial [Racocetra persica]
MTEEVDLELETKTKHFVIPYHLYLCIECELNHKNFIVAVVTDVRNLLKPGYQCTCSEVKSEIES